MNVLFIDFDGVLNSNKWLNAVGFKLGPDDRLDPVAIARLNDFTKRSGCLIVVSSAWRLAETLESMQALLCRHGVEGEVVGMTRDLWKEKSDAVRGDEIQDWMDSHNVFAEDIVIIDDDSDMAHLHPRLVQTLSENGLQDWHIERMLEKLKERT